MPIQVKDVEGCRNCPLFQDGTQNFVGDKIVENSTVLVCGQNPGAEEEKKGEPFVGPTGKIMDIDYLPVLGLSRSAVSFGNAIRCRWNNSNELPLITSTLAREAVDHCTRSHLRVPSGAKLIVTQGAYALYAMTGHGWEKNDKITSWRGWMLPRREEDGTPAVLDSVYTPSVGSDIPVLASLHIAAVARNPALKLPTKMDWDRGRRFLRGKWPNPVPEIHSEIDELMFAPEAAWDTEFIPEHRILLRFSVCTGDRTYVIENHRDLRKTLARSLLQTIVDHPATHVAGLHLQLQNGVWGFTEQGANHRLLFQNAVADLPYLATIFPEGMVVAIEDEMLAHSVLFGGEAHSLDYLSSLCSSINRHKHLDRRNPRVYSGCDALTQCEVWRWMEKRFQTDADSEKVYREYVLPLVPTILESEERGVLIDQEQVKIGVDYLNFEMQDSTDIAQAASGYKINLGSNDQVGNQLYNMEGLKVPRGGR